MLGQFGENLAQDYLERHGYRIVARNWRHGRYGEIDLVAYDPRHGHLAIVEVKTRRSTQYGSGLEAITPRKQEKLRLLAEVFLATQPLPDPIASISMDVIAITPGNPPQILHIPAAF